jgi:hypothetical protein
MASNLSASEDQAMNTTPNRPRARFSQTSSCAAMAAFAFACLASFAPGQAAEAWNIPHERIVTIKGKVVDLLCELKKDCPQECGKGRRQLGILQEDGKLRFAAKGGIDFAGAALDLQPYCGRLVEADGLLIENPAVTLFFVQGLRTDAARAFSPAEAFIRDWTARNGKAEEWWRKDPVALGLIGENGPFGIKGLLPEKKKK